MNINSERRTEQVVICLCGTPMKLKNSKYGPFYGCPRYPECEVSVGAHPVTWQPLGTPADRATKAARIRAHNAFDQLWKGGPINWKRTDCYIWMQQVMGITAEQAHIGQFNEEQCEQLIALVRHEFESRRLVLLDKPPAREKK